MSFVGSIALHSAPTSLPSSGISRAFHGGRIHAGGATRVEDVGQAICLLQGQPVFADPQLAALALQEGDGAAWLQAFARHGIEAPSQVRGRFAVVVLLPAEQRAFMATDRFGTWPVCFSADGASLHFSDRANTVPLEKKRLSPQALFDYLYYHCIPAPQTAFEGVSRLPAGHAAEWKAGLLRVHPYWRPHFQENRQPDLESSKRDFVDIVARAVQREASGGGRVGAFLSGGTDSSTVSGLLCRTLGEPADTYSIGFDATGYDEMEYARIAARHFGTRHHEYYVTPDDLLQGIPKVAAHYDQPFGNSSAVPAWVCARKAREDGIDKLLAGDGGDELFGGNVRYAKQHVFGLYDRVPALVRHQALEPFFGLSVAKNTPLVKKAASYIEQARVPMPDRMQMYNLLWRLGPEVVLEPAFLKRVNLDGPADAQRSFWGQADAGTLLNRMLAFDWKYTLADNDLPKVIGTTQLAGLEVGFPLLSDELLEFSLRLPTDWKLKGMSLRWFFKEALRDILPHEIIVKQKHGFGLPFGVWACSHAPLRAMAGDALHTLAGRGLVRPDFIKTLLETHLPAHPGYYGEMVWILMMLEFWLREHDPGWTLDA